MKSRTVLTVVAVLGLTLAACDEGEVALSTTSSLVTGTTEAPSAPATTTAPEDNEDDTVTSTTLRGETVASFEVRARISTDDGEILYILIPEGAYTDVDLENFVFDLIESDESPWGAEVFDDEAAIQAFAIPEEQRTEEQQQSLDEHHFVSLIEGDTISFRGPFSEFGEYVLSS